MYPYSQSPSCLNTPNFQHANIDSKPSYPFYFSKITDPIPIELDRDEQRASRGTTSGGYKSYKARAGRASSERRNYHKQLSLRPTPVAHLRVTTGDASPNPYGLPCWRSVDSTAAPLSEDNVEDKEAANMVKQCLKRQKNTRWGRTLHKRLNRELNVDVDALDSIFSAADTVFFSRRLRNKVEWRWSYDSEPGYDSDFVGTTTPRYSGTSGIDAVVVLSRPFLLSGKYSSNLLLSTFLHELVHCYIFICCGGWTQDNGGHTPGFKNIVRLIHCWSGNSELQLCNMRANLVEFLAENDSCCLLWPSGSAISEPVDLYTRFALPIPWEESDETVMDGRRRVLAEESETTLDYDRFPSPWHASPQLPYISRQELAGAVEGSASMPIFVD